jgi:sulfate permease, SulP family
MVVNGSLSKTAVNGGAGARSQLSGVTAAVLTVVTLLFLTGLFEQLPEATLAAVVIGAVIELVDVSSLTRLYRVQTGRLAAIYRYTSRADFIGAVAALLGVLLFDTLPGLIIGVIVSLVLLVARTSRPHVAVLGRLPDTHDLWVDTDRHEEAVRPPHVLVVRVEGQLFFGNADYVRERIRALAHEDTHDGAPARRVRRRRAEPCRHGGGAGAVRDHRRRGRLGHPVSAHPHRGRPLPNPTRTLATSTPVPTRSVT